VAENQYPRQTYWPSAKARLIFRIDEFGGPLPAAPTIRGPVRKGKGVDTTLRIVQKDGVFLLLNENDEPGNVTGPQSQKGPDDFEFVAIPKTAQLGRNSPRTASTLSMEFKYGDLPVDPRVIRSCGVEFYIGTVSGRDFQAGVLGETRSVGDGGATSTVEPLHLVPDTFTDQNGVVRSNLRFQGFADQWEVHWSEGEPLIKIECTDNTRLLMDQPAPAQLTLNEKIPLDKAIATYLANFPQFRGLGVMFLPAGETPPALGPALQKTSFKPTLGPAPSKGGGASTGSKMSVWDYIIDITASVGFLVRVLGNTIVIEHVRQLFTGSRLERRADDPFRPRLVPGRDTPIERRTFIYGRNIEDLQITRNFTKHAPINIELRCYFGKRKKPLISRFPDKANRQKQVNPGNASEEKWLVLLVAGIEDQDTLNILAQGYYESIGRNELGAKFSTRNLSSFGGGNDDPDVLDMYPGDSIDILTTREEEEFATVNRIEDLMSMQDRAQNFLTQLGFPDDFAKRYATAFVNIGIQTTFKVRKIGMNWSEDHGLDIDVESVNYIVVRANQKLEATQKQEPENQQPDEPTIINVEEIV
jgi:hypothetical protein